MTLENYKKNVEYKQRRIDALKVIMGNKCISCGTSKNLEFDHINPKTKNFSITTYAGASNQKFLREASKCQLLCKSCHSFKTWATDGRKRSKHGSISMYTNKKCRCDLCRAGWRLHQNNYMKKRRKALSLKHDYELL